VAVVYFITPWYGETAHLIPEYAAATAGGRVIAVDNGTPTQTGLALTAAAQEHGWQLVRPGKNLGFSMGNNAGFAAIEGAAPDDIVCFLNSDVRANGLATALLAQVVYPAVYGPSLQAQLVAGRWMPYLEGWCLAMRYDVAKKLRWRDWPDPYWEDNAYCLTALHNGFPLIHTALPVQHIGGQSAGSLARHGRGFERNRAEFVRSVFTMFDQSPEVPKSATFTRYQHELHQQSDIHHHLPLLYSLAKGTVVELGTRTGVSTAALLSGVERHGGTVTSVDIDDVSALYRGHPQWRCVRGSSTDPATAALVEGQIDVLLVDTEHTYEQVTDELAVWGPRMRVGGVVLFHDPETFPGVRAAVEDWSREHGFTPVFVLPNNGMAIVEVTKAIGSAVDVWPVDDEFTV
jgi:predicted O-methyltransferase YrrM